MPTYIKTGLWDKKPTGYKGELDLNLFIAQNASSVIGVNGTSLYSTNPLAGPNISPDYTIALGEGAGENATYAALSNFIGHHAGQEAANANSSNFIGFFAGVGAANANESNFLGYNAGQNATNANYSNFLGSNAGSFATNAYQSNFLGLGAGTYAVNAYRSNFLGTNAGNGATNANNSNFLGQFAGYQATTADRSNFLGREAGMNSTGNNVNAFGYQAHKGGTLSGQTVFSNSSLPSYTNRSAATTAITVPNGAVVGNTYLYYNQTTFAIEAVRL